MVVSKCKKKLFKDRNIQFNCVEMKVKKREVEKQSERRLYIDKNFVVGGNFFPQL